MTLIPSPHVAIWAVKQQQQQQQPQPQPPPPPQPQPQQQQQQQPQPPPPPQQQQQQQQPTITTTTTTGKSSSTQPTFIHDSAKTSGKFMDTLICGICADLPAKFSLYLRPSCTEGSCSASTGQQPSHSACGSRALFPGAEGAPQFQWLKT